MAEKSFPSAALLSLLARERLPRSVLETIAALHAPLAERIAARAQVHGRPFTVGICGAQGSGKSTLAAIVRELLVERGLSVATLSLDDCYLTRSEREQLARHVHPLLATRGVPGTHDVTLAERTLDALRSPGTATLPAFDKALDDRCPSSSWTRIATPVDVVLFEGWCVGAKPQDAAALRKPLNALEREHDPNGTWRGYVNAQLGTRYRALFARIDELVLLKAPSFEVVYEWRAQQERKLRERIEREGGDPWRVMSDSAVRRFIAHYERLTRHILAEMPARADLVIELDRARQPLA